MAKAGILGAVLLILALPAMEAQPAGGDRCEILPFQATEKTLANGLRVIVVPTGLPKIVSLQISVQTGPRTEVEPGNSGFAHLFEHLTFQGTPKYPQARYAAMVANASARQNAYTTDDFTNFQITFSKDDLESILEAEADRFQNLSWSEGDFARQVTAIRNEYQRISSSPVFRLFEAQREKAFTVHPYRHAMMGTKTDLDAMSRQFEHSRAFFDRWYRPEYTTILLVGDVDPQAALALVEKLWGSWKRGTYVATIPQEPEAKGPVYQHVPWRDETAPWVTVAFHSPAFSATEKDFAALQTLLDAYFGPASDIRRRLMEEEERVDVFGADLGSNTDPALATIYARVRNIRDVTYIRDQILKTVAQARSAEVPAPVLAEVKSNARYAFRRALDSTDAIAAALTRYVRFDREYGTLNTFFCTQASLTAEDLRAAGSRYLTDANMVVTTLSHQRMPKEMAKLPKIDETVVKETEASVAGGEFPVVVQKSELPHLIVKIVFTAGSAHDPVGKEGVAALAAAMITSGGSQAMSAREITDALFPIAGTFSAQVDKEMTTLTGRIDRHNWSRFADIVLPMLLEPGLRRDDFRRLKKAQLDALDALLSNEEEVARELLLIRSSVGFAYRHPSIGNVAGVESINLSDVRKFIRKHYTTGNLMLGLSGDVPDAMTERLRSSLRQLPGGTAGAPPLQPMPPHGLAFDIIDKESGPATIVLGHSMAVTRSHADFAALSVARSWLGEHGSPRSRLFQRISHLRGLNDGAFAYTEAFPRAATQAFPEPNVVRRRQVFEMVLRPVAAANAHMAIRIAIWELRKLIENGLTVEQFNETRDYMIKNIELAMADPNRKIGDALDAHWYRLPAFDTFLRQKLLRLSVEDVNRAIRKHLSVTNLAVVVITPDARKLRASLLSNSAAAIVYEEKRPQTLLDEDAAIRNFTLDVDTADIRTIPLSEVFVENE